MAQKVGFELEIETKKSTRDAISDIELQLHEVNKELREAKKLGQTDVYKSLRSQQQGLKDEAKKLTRELKEQDTQLSDLVDNFRIGFVRIGDFKAGLANTQKSMGILTKSIKANITITKAWKVALASTGIGLIVIALGSLVAWLTQTQKGIDLVNRGLAAFEAGVGVVVETFTKLFKEGPKALIGIGGRLKEAIVETDKLTKSNQDLVKTQQDLQVETARVREEEKALSKIAEDTSKSDKERAEAAAKAIELETELLAKRVEFQETVVANAEKELELLGDLAKNEDRQKVIDAQTELAQLNEESLERQTTLNSKLNVANAAMAKGAEDARKATEKSVESLTQKIGRLNDELSGGAFTGNALRDKIKEIIALEEEVERIEDSIRRTREEITRGETAANFSQIDTIDGASSLSSTTRIDPAIAAAKAQVDKIKEIEKKAAEEQLAFDKEIAQRRSDIREDGYAALGQVIGDFQSGLIENEKDFAKASLAVLVDTIEKQVQISLAGLLPQLIGKLGPVKGTIAFVGIQALVKAALNTAKSAAKLEKGGTLDGFVADGPRHAHGGIPLGNGQEIEGGEPVLTRRAAVMFPNQINAINMAAGGRRILADGGIIGGSAGPVLPASFFNQSNGVDGDELSKQVASAVYQAMAKGLMDGSRRLERENEFQNRNVA